jgi:hypothetical protein
MNSSPITDEMIEAGVAEAHNQAHRTYSDMCRAIYLAMRSSAPSVMTQEGLGADPALIPSEPSQSPLSRPIGFDPGAVWLTNEKPPRRLVVKGTAAIDPDILVAEFEDGSKGYKGKTLWIVKSSGFVCGIHDTFDPKLAVYAQSTGETK